MIVARPIMHRHLGRSPPCLAQFDYKTRAYSPGVIGTKRIFFCSVNDEAGGVRATGVAIYLDNSPWPSRCVVAARAQNGAMSIKQYGVVNALGPPILINPKGLQIYQWLNPNTNQNLWKCGDDVGPPPHNFVCPLVMANYPEPWVSPMPIRRYCRFKPANSATYVYGWTDARYQNGLRDNICYAVSNPIAASLRDMRVVTSRTFDVLGFFAPFQKVAPRGASSGDVHAP